MLPADLLYRKMFLRVRGSLRPVTLVNVDMFRKRSKMFLNETEGN